MLTSAVGASAATGGPRRASFRILCRRWPSRNLKSLRRSWDTRLSAAALSWDRSFPLAGQHGKYKDVYIPPWHYSTLSKSDPCISRGDTWRTLPSHIYYISLQTPELPDSFAPLAQIHVLVFLACPVTSRVHSFQFLKCQLSNIRMSNIKFSIRNSLRNRYVMQRKMTIIQVNRCPSFETVSSKIRRNTRRLSDKILLGTPDRRQ